MFALKERYKKEYKAALMKDLGIKNPMLVPKVEKIVISVGVGQYAKETKIIENIRETISLLSGQKAVTIKAKKSVAGFKVREGMPSGIKVTLRGDMMYNFLEKLIVIALPRVRDFRGISNSGFDGNGNYSFGITEQLIFPEIEYDNIMVSHGMNINMVTTASSDAEAHKLLEMLGLPFKRRRNG